MRMTAVTLFDEARARVGEASSTILAGYCERHGYALRVHRQMLDRARNVSWNKLIAVREALDDSDWVFWFDADVFVLDEERPLTDLIQPEVNMVVSQDAWGLCTGMFGLRSCSWSAELLHTWWFLGRPNVEYTDARWEQNTLKLLVDCFPEVAAKVALIPESVVANPETDARERAFALHYWVKDHSEEKALAAFEAARFGRTAAAAQADAPE